VGSSGAECASDARAVAAAHPIERSMGKAVVIVRHGAHLVVAQKWTSSVHAVQQVDDLTFVRCCGSGAEDALLTTENGFLHSQGPRGEDNGVAWCGHRPCRALVWTWRHGDARVVAARSPLHNVDLPPGISLGPLVDEH
jgi:hypothetical protein